MRGLIISFEGPEGGGKTTQANMLVKSLISMGYDAEFIREPGGTNISEKIRQILLDKKNTEMSYHTEALLYAASRAQLIEERVIPDIKKGKWIIFDRYFDSSVAYQGMGRGLGIEFIQSINRYAILSAKPDITFLLDIDIEDGLDRKKIQRETNRMDMQDIDFYNRVRETYLTTAKNNPDYYCILDANLNYEEIHDIIMHKVIKKYYELQPNQKSGGFK